MRERDKETKKKKHSARGRERESWQGINKRRWEEVKEREVSITSLDIVKELEQ